MNKRPARIFLALSLCLAALAPAAAHAASPPLTLDPSFGLGGVVEGGSQPGYRAAAGVAVAPDGDVLVAGVDFLTETVVVARYLPNGVLDPSYGTGGIVSLGGSVQVVASSSLESVGGINDFEVDERGRALLLWRGSRLTRLTADGSVDESFGAGGTVALSAERSVPHFTALAPLPGGRIVLTGFGYGTSHIFVARLRGGGSPDPSFGHDGIASVGIGDRERNSVARRIAVARDGRITIAGFASRRPALVRLRPDGSPDPSFGHHGRALAPRWISGEASALTLTPRGGALVGCRCRRPGRRETVRALLRFGPRGGFDRRFSTASIRTEGTNAFRPRSLFLIGRRIIAAGGGNRGQTIQAYHADGRPGPSLASVPGIPRDRLSGFFSARRGRMLTVAWTTRATGSVAGGIRLQRFLVH